MLRYKSVHVQTTCLWKAHLCVSDNAQWEPSWTDVIWWFLIVLKTTQLQKINSRLKTSTTDQSTVHPSYNHWMNVSTTCLKLHLRSQMLNVLHLETTKWLIQEKITNQPSQTTNQQAKQLLCPQSGLLIAKLTVPQLVKHFPTFYGTCRFITVQKILPPVPAPSHINPVHVSNPATTLLHQVHPGWDTNRPCNSKFKKCRISAVRMI